MKKIFYILASAIVALGAVACDNEGLDNIAPEANGDTVSFVATIDNTKTDLGADLSTVWTAGDVIKVEWNGKTYHFTNSDDDVNTFSCTDEGLSAIKTAEIKATYSNNNDGAIDSEAGTAGALLTYEGAFSDIMFEVKNAFLTITADKGATIALTASADIFSNGKSIELTATGTEQYIAVNPETTTIALSINGESIKTSQENTLAVKKIYNLGNYYKQLDDIEKDKRYIFTKATEFTPGKWYAMVAENNAATASTRNYDRMASTAVIALTDGISLPAACAFGFVSAEGGYTIQQYDMDYLQSTTNYDTFNFLATAPESGHIWSVEFADGVATIVNTDTDKSLSYSPNFKNFEANATLNTAPALYELVEVDTNAHILGTSVSSLSYTADGGEKTFTVTTYGEATLAATSAAEWLTVSVADGVVTVVAAANEGEARDAEVTVTFGEESMTVDVSQGALVADGAEVTDTINNAFTGVGTTTSYSTWSGKTGTSGAVYAGQSAGDAGTVQMRSNNSNSGIVTTTSGGKVTKIVITWNTTKTTNTSRTVDIYGSHTAFSQATDMYNSKKTDATKIASAKLANATDGVSEVVLDGTYEFVGFRSNSGALYLDSVKITWVK